MNGNRSIAALISRMTRMTPRTVVVGWALFLCVAGIGCSRDEPPPSSATEEAPPPTPAGPAQVEYGAESVEAFKQRFAQAFAANDFETYRQLHCWDQLPANMRTALTGATQHKALKIFSFPCETIEIEPMTAKDLEQAQKGKWDIQPSFWVMVHGAERGQFKHWALGELAGRYYFATRLN